MPTLEARCSLKSAVWRRIEWVHKSAKDKTTTWPPDAGSAWKSCFDQLGHDRSAVIIQRCAACPRWHEFPRSFLVAAIIFPHTKWLKKITDYRDTPALRHHYRLFSHNVVTMETSAIGWPPWLITSWYLLISEQLYMLMHEAMTWFLQIQRYQNGINQGGHPIALVSMATTLCETRL